MILLGAEPWRTHANRHWTCNTDLAAGSNKRHSTEELRKDAMDTIEKRYPQCEVIIYTDGSAADGTGLGGSAAVITTNDVRNPRVMDRKLAKGRTITSSFETEAGAMGLAADWIGNDDG